MTNLGIEKPLAGPIAGAEFLLNEHEAAAFLGLSVKTLRRWRWLRRGVAFIKIGGAVRYSPADLRDFIASGRQEMSGGEVP